MEDIKTYKSDLSDLKNNLFRISDIINIDGPLLSLFQDTRNKDLYLFDWVEGNNTTNRWLIYNISPQILYDFLLQSISYKYMFNSVNENSFYYTDIIYSENVDYAIHKLDVVPTSYKPKKEAFFDINDAPQLSKIFVAIEDLISNKTKFEYNKVKYIFSFNSFEILQQPNLEDEKYIQTDQKHTIINVHNNSNFLERQSDVTTYNRISEQEPMGFY